MRYFRQKKTNEVYGYDPIEQADYVAACEGNKEDWLDVTDSWPPAPTAAEIAAENAAIAKAVKQKALAEIVVTTTSGKTFDGNETARLNMLSAITAAGVVGQTSSQWKLADNTVEVVTLDEIKEALALAIQAVGAIVTAG